MIENWRKSVDLNGHAGALLSDLFKAFGCKDHNLISKVNVYSFDKDPLN